MRKGTFAAYCIIVLLSFSQLADCMSISDAKKLPDGQSVTLSQKAITYAASGFFYIEEDTRYVGIRVDKLGHGLSVGMRADITGVIRTDGNDERYIQASSAVHNGDQDLKPLGMANKLLGGGDFYRQPTSTCGQRGVTGLAGVNNIGLLVRVMGYVTDSGTYPRTNTTWFYVDDGSAVEDGTGAVGLYCEAENITPPAVGSLLRVTGISSCEVYNNNLVNLLWVRDIEDIPVGPSQPPQPPAPTVATARAGFSPDIPAPEGGIKISWDASLANGKNVIEYHIWRDAEQTPIGAVAPVGLSYFIDDVAAGTRYVSYLAVDPVTHNKTTATANLSHPAIGAAHRYYVSAVYQTEQPAGSGAFKYYETDKAPTGPATITSTMYSADLLSPYSDQWDVDLLAGVSFQFNSRMGADDYIIQLSTSPIFSAPEYTSPVVKSSPDADNVPISFDTNNVSALFSNAQAGSRLWWRVGVRNSHDSPGPVPNMGKPDMTFLFSEPNSFYVAETPPPPPGSIVATARAAMYPDIPVPEGGTKISWNPNGLDIGRTILEYHIWRDTEAKPVGSVAPDGLSCFIDDVGTGTRPVSYAVIDLTTHTKTTATAYVNRVSTGIAHQYYVSAVYQMEEPRGSGVFHCYETDRSPTGLATITQKVLAGDLGCPPQGCSVDLTSGLPMVFSSRKGADTYVVQISSSPTFSAPEYTSPLMEFSPAADGQSITFETGNISGRFGAATQALPLWWRVGVRNSQDTPGPIPNMGLMGMEFLFSEASSFYMEEAPPLPFPAPVTARAGFFPDIDAPEGGIRIAWTQPFEPAGGHGILEYHVWRDIEPTPVGTADSSTTVFVDDVGVEARKFLYSVVDPATHTIATAGGEASRPSTGFSHQYYVSATYQVEQPLGSGIIRYYETNKIPAGPATIARRMLADDLLEPFQGQRDVDVLSGINFQFNSRMGADTYLVQVSSVPSFLAPEYTSAPILFSPYADNIPISFSTGNIKGYFGSLPDMTQLWWRVGMRNSLDTPGPVANMGSGMNYLFSEPSSFHPAETPPPPPF